MRANNAVGGAYNVDMYFNNYLTYTNSNVSA